ncbi:DNA sulfur modification protein DndD [Limnoraphis robusta Tam1]|uniref:DNA sulfur modification protein DndD n=1 Tax=Limnoraphis robusta TaxID=1118279 RepID=UPI002B1F822F|nr:DNA sulfur modification protein DndD [Limnoraphis robusta]MEA5497020.1 DNA sulfur modification protein DndD [Limnoraphis robusta BA-68 BA1]MEA5539578.1 DNA sulfur modification protein DndD [Limnoraphis robusta Tam1]
MIFLELVLQNFGPYQGRQTINLRPEENGNLRPIILFGGMNGGGKTTLMDAIRLALYGQRAQCSTRGNLSYNDFLTQCVNSNASPIEKTRVELVFEHVKDGKMAEWRIVRTWTKNPKDGKDELGIVIGEWPDKSIASIWDEYIENILPLGISKLFLFDGEQVKELAELETPPQAVIDAIYNLLGLELATRLSIDLSILSQRKRKDVADIQERADIEEIEQRLAQQQEEKKAAQQKLDELKQQLVLAEKHQQKASDKFVSEGGKIAQESSQLQAKVKDLEEARDSLRQTLRKLAAETLPLNLIYPLLIQAEIQADKEIKRQQSIAAREVLQERDSRLIDYITKISLDEQSVHQIQSFLQEENQALEQEIETEIQPYLEVDTEAVNDLKTVLNIQLPSQNKQAKDCLEQLKTLQDEIDATETKLQTAAAPEVYKKLEEKLKLSQTELLKAQAAYEEGQRNSDQIQRAFTQTKKQLDTYGGETLKSKSSQDLVNRIQKVQETLTQFKEKLTLKKLNKLEVEVAECFRYLLHKSDLVHRVTIDTENFSLSLYNLEGKPVPKHRLSAGEKQLLAIAFLWGLARVSGRNLPVAIDTPLGRLDSSHRHNLIERYFPSASHQVILLSTDTEIGEAEVQTLREQEAIAHEYLLKYDSRSSQTVIEAGYFFS